MQRLRRASSFPHTVDSAGSTPILSLLGSVDVGPSEPDLPDDELPETKQPSAVGRPRHHESIEAVESSVGAGFAVPYEQALLIDGQWKATRASVCALLSKGGGSCDPGGPSFPLGDDVMAPSSTGPMPGG